MVERTCWRSSKDIVQSAEIQQRKYGAANVQTIEVVVTEGLYRGVVEVEAKMFKLSSNRIFLDFGIKSRVGRARVGHFQTKGD